MLKTNIKLARKSKGISQEELAMKLNVVRQTISKWEQGLSVPDAEMLISISKNLDVPVSVLLGEDISDSKVDDLKVISEKLEVINLQLFQRNNTKRKNIHLFFILVDIIIILISLVLFYLNSSYLNWNYNQLEYAVLGVSIHSFEWLFVRISPVLFILAVIGALLTRKKS